jgi:hypothetical protein
MADASRLVESWFGASFALLHPQLQALHGNGGVLRGPCRVMYGKGLAGLAGKLLAKRLGIVDAGGDATLTVTIASDAAGLLWSRRFNDGPAFASHFEPVGHFPDGYWLERSGAIKLRFGVAIEEGGWHWRQQRLSWLGIPLSGWLMPRTIASKAVIDGAYVFSVAVRFPLLGTVLSYRGSLALLT